jgi:hypothetical protein
MHGCFSMHFAQNVLDFFSDNLEIQH